MPNLTPSNSYDDIYQLETTDPVLGGPGGIANRQGQQLLNRTVYLKAILDAIQAEIIAARNGTVSLDTRLDAFDTTLASKADLAEIIAARNGAASLDIRLDAFDTTLASKALLAGSVTQVFSAAPAVAPANVPRLDQFPASLGATGYQRLPGGFTIQWGRYGAPITEATYTVNFPVAFTTACVGVFAVAENSTAVNTNDVHAQVKDFTTTTANIFINHSPGGGPGSDVGTGFSWLALGY